MELKSSAISETWKFRAFWSLVGCFITLVFLNQNQQKLDFSLVLGQFHPRFVTNTILSHPTVVSEPPADQPAFSLEEQLLNNSTSISSANHTKVEKSVNINSTSSSVVSQPISSNPADQSAADSATNQTKVVESKVNASPPPPPPPSPPPPLPVEQPVIKSTTSTEQKGSLLSCNIFEGKWVYNADNQPYYNSTRCPFVEEKFSCQKNGRPDSDYEKWRWVANDCDIPLFDGKDMLERLRNKRLIIVGDSLNRNQWESLACLLYSSIPDPSRAEVSAGGPTYKFITAKDYNCTVEFYWSPFLVNSNDTHKSGRKVLTLDELTPLYPRFKGADVMVFNSGHWWTHAGKLRSWDVFEYEGKLVEEMPIELAFERAMKTWAKWVEKNVDPKKTKVFFRSISAAHHGRTWCYNNTQPILDDSYDAHFPQKLRDSIERLIEGPSMNKLGVKYLNITKLSEYRRDAHPSMYRNTQWKQGTFQTQFADCSHWCLPGLPDTWNRLLYASLFFDTPSL